MPISERELKDLVAAGVIDAGTAERIAAHFKDAGAEPPRFDLTHTAYYLGALVVMSALGWFMNEAWARYRGRGVAVAQARSQAARRAAVHPRGLDDAARGVRDPIRAGMVAAGSAGELSGVLPANQRQLGRNGGGHHRGGRGGPEAAAIPVPDVPAGLRVVVSVARSGRSAHRIARPRRLRAEAADHAAVRRNGAGRDLPARPSHRPGLRLLAVPVRSRRVLGRADL